MKDSNTDLYYNLITLLRENGKVHVTPINLPHQISSNVIKKIKDISLKHHNKSIIDLSSLALNDYQLSLGKVLHLINNYNIKQNNSKKITSCHGLICRSYASEVIGLDPKNVNPMSRGSRTAAHGRSAVLMRSISSTHGDKFDNIINRVS